MHLQKLKDQLELHEGFRSKPYLDTNGYWTIGIGRNLDTNPLNSSEKRYLFGDSNISPSDSLEILHLEGLTRLQAHHLLENDIQVALKFIRRLSANFEVLSEPRQFALIDMMFNLGYGTMRKRFQIIIDLIENEEYTHAVEQIQNTKYSKQVGHRDNRLCVMILKNKYHDEVTQREILKIENV
jgi:GH24 family phage-related lysozyme (muramidase)